MPHIPTSRIVFVRTDKDTHFAGAIAQNEGAHETLTPGTNGWRTALPTTVKGLLRSIKILSKENLSWEVWLFGNSSFATTNADTEKFLGRWTFAAADGVRATVAAVTDTYYHYYIDGLGVPVVDDGNLGQIYVRLVCRTAAGKSAGAAGEVVLELGIEPTRLV